MNRLFDLLKKKTDPPADPLHTPAKAEEKISEKMFSKNLLVAALSIFLCIIALCSVTYAWFTTETASGNNTLTSGAFSLEIAVAGGGETVPVTDSVKGSKVCTLAAGTYTVTLTPAEGSTVKGYCTVKLGEAVYTTSPIFPDATAGATSLSFTVTVAAETTAVFTPKWGYPANPTLSDGATIVIEGTATETV